MKATRIIFAAVLLISDSISAQVEHSETINANGVSAIIGDIGNFFNNSNLSYAGYEVPAGNNTFTIFSTSIIAGAMDAGNQLYVTSNFEQFGGNNDWRSGPIANPAEYFSVAYLSAYEKAVWKVTRQQVDNHVQNYQQIGYTPDPSIAGWPGNGDVSLGVAQNLAPFVDMDNDGNYEPMEGDYPDFPGDQVVYVILNDDSYLPTNPLGIELHLMFYQFIDANYLNETTFLNTRAYNRSTRNYLDYKQTFFVDFDIGNFADDYFGCDSVRNMIYGYNSDTLDETNAGNLGFGNNPPCQALISLNQPMTAAIGGAGAGGGPVSLSSDTEVWNIMNGNWSDGSPMFYGGDGHSVGTSTNTTTHLFTGNPYTGTGWLDFGPSSGNPPLDIRGFMTTSLGDLPAGTMACADYAFIYDDSEDHLKNVQNVMYIADALKNLYDTSSGFPCTSFLVGLTEAQTPEFSIYPNPSSGVVNIKIENISGGAEIQVHDLMGRVIFDEVTEQSLFTLQLQEEPGFYAVTVNTELGSSRKILVLD